MKVLNNNCRNDISDQECYHCSMNGHITECPEKCEQFEPVMSQELMDHYKALGEHYNNKASRIVMETYMLGRRDAQKKRDNKVSDLIRRQDVLKICDKYNGQGWVWSMIRKEAEELPSVEQEPCADAISRQAAIKAITNTSGIRGDALNALYDLPPVNPTKTGHWISHYDEDAKEGWYECDRCHTERAFNTDYCPDCGAKMSEIPSGINCDKCEHFKILYEPIRGTSGVIDTGRARCSKYDLIKDFSNHGQFKYLQCPDKAESEEQE